MLYWLLMALKWVKDLFYEMEPIGLIAGIIGYLLFYGIRDRVSNPVINNVLKWISIPFLIVLCIVTGTWILAYALFQLVDVLYSLLEWLL